MHQIAYADFSAIVIRTCLWQTAAAKSVSTVIYPPGNVWFMSDILFLLSLRYTERVHLPKPPKRDKLMMEHCPPSCTLPHIASVLCIFGQLYVLGLPALHGIKAKCKAKLTNIQQFSVGGIESTLWDLLHLTEKSGLWVPRHVVSPWTLEKDYLSWRFPG